MSEPGELRADERAGHAQLGATLVNEVGKVLVGQELMVQRLLTGLLTGGHVLLEGVPGLAKTLTVRCLAQAIDTGFSRIQFTPDMLPADVIGTEIFNPKEGTYSVKKGPIFANLVLADEINRAPAKVQSALLEAMQERQATIGTQTYPLEEPFLVLATQNPIEQEGTYPLPEAQLDRFLMEIDVGYPDIGAERQMLIETTGIQQSQAKAVMNPQELMNVQNLVRRVPVGESVVETILAIVRNGRPESSELEEVRSQVAWGPGPRASQALMLAVRARALLDGRFVPSVDDVIALAHPVLKHRMALSFAARADGVTLDHIIAHLAAPYT